MTVTIAKNITFRKAPHEGRINAWGDRKNLLSTLYNHICVKILWHYVSMNNFYVLMYQLNDTFTLIKISTDIQVSYIVVVCLYMV